MVTKQSKSKYPPISFHPTLRGQLEVDWQQEYNGEFFCPHCKTGKITRFYHNENSLCKLQLRCQSCRKSTYLTQTIPSFQRKPPISIHPTLHGQLEVNWQQDYHDEFFCPHCQTGKISFIHHKKTLCKLQLRCKSCKKSINLTQKVHSFRQKPPISIHPTLYGQLEVDWQQDYHDEFLCPHCQTDKITSFSYKKDTLCKLVLCCKSCGKSTNLTQYVSGLPKNNPPISIHKTLDGILKVDWRREYQQEYNCPHCNKGKLTKHYHAYQGVCKLVLRCDICKKDTHLTCPVPVHIFGYLPEIECPNPLCTDIGPNGKKGWVYQIKRNKTKCYFCQIEFDPDSISPHSWVGRQTEDKLLPFSFDEDTWDLRHFYAEPDSKTVNFQTVNPDWYRQETKKYLHYSLKSKVSTSSVTKIVTDLRQFGNTLVTLNIKNKSEIDRSTVIHFLDNRRNLANLTTNRKLSRLRDFFDWLDLETPILIRSRDFLKISTNDPDWLDEVTREAINQHLDKIPAPIASQYLVQAYIAARPVDVCRLAFDCLVEENGKWYINFFQAKGKRWHRILASRKIRKVVEEQQQWIREVFDEDYSYLFCHFWNIQMDDYPEFSKIRPLPQPPPTDSLQNPMVRIIQKLMEKENVLDANGQKPHFTGSITRPSRLQEVRTKYGIEAAKLYADHKSSTTTFQYYAPPTREQIAQVDLPFQELLMNPDNKFLPWQSLPESLLKNPKAHELDLEIAPRLVVYGHCALDPKIPCPVNLFPKCYGCSSFRPSTSKLPLYERQYQGEQQRFEEAKKAGAELACEEAKATIEAMDKWLPELKRLANG